MSFMDNVRQAVEDAKTKANQFKNNDFKEAVIAVAALIAMADGRLDPSEKALLAQAIQRNEALKVFPASDLGRLFNQYCDEAGDTISAIGLIQKIGKLSKKREQAIACAAIGLAIANEDGVFAPEEKAKMKQVLGALGLQASDLGISLD